MSDVVATRQFLRYASVGLLSNTMLYLAYLGVTACGIGHKVAMTSLYALGVLLTFAANRRWTFNHKGGAHRPLARYLTAYAFGYVLNLALLWVGVDHFGLQHQGVQAIAVIIVAFSLFIIHKFWVFAPERL